MAGDWIKMRVSLATDPAVIGIAARLDCTEFEVVGMLHHLWSWADIQSRDGHATGVTEKWIDRYVQRDKFAQAMQLVGWLVITEDGVEFPNFDRHNGETAKTRALASNRQKKRRANVTAEDEQMSRCERDKSVTREEKRREEIEDQKLLPSDDDEQRKNQKPERIDYEGVFEAYARNLPKLPQVRIKDDARKRAIKTIIGMDKKFAEPDFFDRYFAYVEKSDFLMGRNERAWKGCCFDWLMKPANLKKIIEGNYHHA